MILSLLPLFRPHSTVPHTLQITKSCTPASFCPVCPRILISHHRYLTKLSAISQTGELSKLRRWFPILILASVLSSPGNDAIVLGSFSRGAGKVRPPFLLIIIETALELFKLKLLRRKLRPRSCEYRNV